MRRALVWLILVAFVIAAPRALAGAQARRSAEPPPGEVAANEVARAAAVPQPERVGADQQVRRDGTGHLPAATDHEQGDLSPASLDDVEYARAEANRQELIAFLADLDHTISEFQAQKGPPSDRGLDQALTAVRDMSGGEVTVLHNALAPLLVTWSAAQARPFAPSSASTVEAPLSAQTTSDLEEMRAKILAYYDRFLPVTDMGSTVDPNFAERLASLRATVEDMSVEDLAQMDAAMASVPHWESVLDVDPSELIASGDGHVDHPLEGPSPQAPVPNGVTIQEHIHPGCRDSAFGPIVTAVLNYLANTGEDLADIWSNDFFIAAFVGTNAPNIPKIITMVIYFPLKIVAMAATVDQVLYMNCNEFLHQTLMEKHDEAMIEVTDLISETLTAIDEDLGVRFDRVDAFHERYRENLIRLAIEKDLGRKGDKRISLFQLPESLCITTGEHEVCGMLETAHEIAEESIVTAKNLGLNTDNAETSLEDGELQQAQGFYKEAYTRYREAYVLAVRAVP